MQFFWVCQAHKKKHNEKSFERVRIFMQGALKTNIFFIYRYFQHLHFVHPLIPPLLFPLMIPFRLGNGKLDFYLSMAAADDTWAVSQDITSKRCAFHLIYSL